VRRLALAVLILLGIGGGVAAEEVPGADAVFAGRGVAILWGIVRGSDEARTRVILRVERIDPSAPWRLVSVEALDPFTREREWVRLAASLDAGAAVTVETSRESFVAKPSRRVLFYADAAALQADRPGLVVSYVSIPDTVPEFASRAELEEHFRHARARLPRP
jgi:hypothetical protein